VLNDVQASDGGLAEVFEAHTLAEEFVPDGDAVGLLGLLHGGVEVPEVHQTHGHFVVVA